MTFYLQRTHYNALSIGRKTPKTAPSPWDFATLLKQDRALAIGNMHENFVKIPRVAPEICLQTDMLITIIRHHSRRQSKNVQLIYKVTGTEVGVPSISSHLVQQEKMKPVHDYLWLVSVLPVLFNAVSH